MSKRHRVATIVVLFFTTLLSLDTADAGLFRHRRCRRACAPSSSEKPAMAPDAPCTSDQVCPGYTTEPPSNPDPVLYYAMKCTMPPTPVPWYGAKGHPPGSCDPCTNCEPPTALFRGKGKHELLVENDVVMNGIGKERPFLPPAKAFKPNLDFKIHDSYLIKFAHFNKEGKKKTVVAQYFNVTFKDPKGDMLAVFAREVVADEEETATATEVETKTHNTKHAWDIKVKSEKHAFTLITNIGTLDREKP